MGCVQSRKDINDVHPNKFHVFIMDEFGLSKCAGQLEVMQNELVLCRRGAEPTRWPLGSLRRYGFDTDIFSFESGRRCATGEGIYAFKCRRAEQLFITLQQCIQARNLNPDGNLPDSLSVEGSRPPGILPRPPPGPPLSHPDYLEPAPAPAASRFSGTIRLGSVSSGPLSPEVHSPGSPSSTDILEVMPLAPLPSMGAQVTNLYQVQDFPQQREHNNNKKVKVELSDHSYSNTRDISTDLATLRHSLQNRQFTQGDDDSSVDIEDFCAAITQSDAGVPLSPTHSTASEHYATLAMEREPDQRLYMNLAPGETAIALSAIREEMGSSLRHSSMNPQTPASTAPSSKRNDFSFALADRLELDKKKHSYVNLELTEVNYDPRLLTRPRNKPTRGMSLDAPPVSEDGHTKVKYAILDLHSSKTGSEGDIAQPLPPSSPSTLAIEYITIDLIKTGALKSVALGNKVDTEGSRKTRHD